MKLKLTVLLVIDVINHVCKFELCESIIKGTMDVLPKPIWSKSELFISEKKAKVPP